MCPSFSLFCLCLVQRFLNFLWPCTICGLCIFTAYHLANTLFQENSIYPTSLDQKFGKPDLTQMQEFITGLDQWKRMYSFCVKEQKGLTCHLEGLQVPHFGNHWTSGLCICDRLKSNLCGPPFCILQLGAPYVWKRTASIKKWKVRFLIWCTSWPVNYDKWQCKEKCKFADKA